MPPLFVLYAPPDAKFEDDLATPSPHFASHRRADRFLAVLPHEPQGHHNYKARGDPLSRTRSHSRAQSLIPTPRAVASTACPRHDGVGGAASLPNTSRGYGSCAAEAGARGDKGERCVREEAFAVCAPNDQTKSRLSPTRAITNRSDTWESTGAAAEARLLDREREASEKQMRPASETDALLCERSCAREAGGRACGRELSGLGTARTRLAARALLSFGSICRTGHTRSSNQSLSIALATNHSALAHSPAPCR